MNTDHLDLAALDRVKVDLGRVFEKGQAYVALSRATSLDGLQVTGFNAAKVRPSSPARGSVHVAHDSTPHRSWHITRSRRGHRTS